MAASSARFLPVDTPTPSMAVPELHMMAFTSAKSTLTRPGMVMMSEMPCTPCARAPAPGVRRAPAWLPCMGGAQQRVTASRPTLQKKVAWVAGGLGRRARLPQDVVGQQEGVLQRRPLPDHVQQPGARALVRRRCHCRRAGLGYAGARPCGSAAVGARQLVPRAARGGGAPVVRDDDQRVDVGAQRLDAVRRLRARRARRPRARATGGRPHWARAKDQGSRCLARPQEGRRRRRACVCRRRPSKPKG